MRSVAAALLLVAATSGGAAASTAAPVARCAAARPEITSTEASVEARVLTGCTAGELVVFRVHGASRIAVPSDVEQNPSARHLWIVDLPVAPEGVSRTQVSHEVYDG